ncbi:hypothetical protein K435DRAFT_808574 [Dendrothele bispora CBS 962.96]|uniref:Uncharacterized protein n=1 Tax=Dendrothele bispora (strain CBS 962.96) TaxID=1314807 RepID=A0A4S8L1C9_DENBC|nr:hypothetical protein K435DRAFT_808574 [Dendrothele bispora CBS 962.96]
MPSGRRAAFSGKRLAFLESQKDAFIIASKNNEGKAKKEEIVKAFFRRFPAKHEESWEPTDAELEAIDDNAPLPEEPSVDTTRMPLEELAAHKLKEQVIAERHITVKAAITRWLEYRLRKSGAEDTGNGNRRKDQFGPLEHLIRQLAGETASKPRKSPDSKVWAKENQAVFREEYDQKIAEWRARGGDTNDKAFPATAYAELINLHWSKLSDEDQKIWAEKSKKLYEEDLKKWENLSYTFSTLPQDRQQCIQNIPHVVQMLLDRICEATGWEATLILGGPEPADAGRLNIISIQGKTTNSKGPNKVTFESAMPDKYKKVVLPMFGDFLKTVFTKAECRARALTEDSADPVATPPTVSQPPSPAHSSAPSPRDSAAPLPVSAGALHPPSAPPSLPPSPAHSSALSPRDSAAPLPVSAGALNPPSAPPSLPPSLPGSPLRSPLGSPSPPLPSASNAPSASAVSAHPNTSDPNMITSSESVPDSISRKRTRSENMADKEEDVSLPSKRVRKRDDPAVIRKGKRTNKNTANELQKNYDYKFSIRDTLWWSHVGPVLVLWWFYAGPALVLRRTSVGPVQNQRGTSTEPPQNQRGTNARPPQNQHRTNAGPVQNHHRTTQTNAGPTEPPQNQRGPHRTSAGPPQNQCGTTTEPALDHHRTNVEPARDQYRTTTEPPQNQRRTSVGPPQTSTEPARPPQNQRGPPQNQRWTTTEPAQNQRGTSAEPAQNQRGPAQNQTSSQRRTSAEPARTSAEPAQNHHRTSAGPAQNQHGPAQNQHGTSTEPPQNQCGTSAGPVLDQ